MKIDELADMLAQHLRDKLREIAETELIRREPNITEIQLDTEWPSGVYSPGPSHPSADAVGVIVRFLDADNDWKQRDLLVLKNGTTGFVDIVDRTAAPITTRDQAERDGAAWLRQ